MVDVRVHLLTFLPFAVESVNDLGQFASSGVGLPVEELFGDATLQLLQSPALFDEGPLVLGWLDRADSLLFQIVLSTAVLVQYALELHQLAVVVQHCRSREADAGAVEQGGSDLLRLTADRVRVVALEEVGVDPLERRVMARQRRLLERGALGFVVAQEMAPVLRSDRLQRAVELQRFDCCCGANGAVRCPLFPDGFGLPLDHRLLGWNVRH